MSNRFRVTAGFVKTIMCTTLENEKCKKKSTKKKWEEWSTFGSEGSIRGKMSASFVTKKYMTGEHMEIMRLLQWWILHQDNAEPYKAALVQEWLEHQVMKHPFWTARTSAVWFLVVSIIETWTAWLELWNRSPGEPGNPDELWAHSKGVWNLYWDLSEQWSAKRYVRVLVAVYDFLSVNLNFILPLIRILWKCSNFVLPLIRSLLLTSPNYSLNLLSKFQQTLLKTKLFSNFRCIFSTLLWFLFDILSNFLQISQISFQRLSKSR